jgi:hypothetical protein
MILVGFANESLMDIIRLGLCRKGSAYCVKVERYDMTNGTTTKGYLYCGLDIAEANAVYARHVTLRN